MKEKASIPRREKAEGQMAGRRPKDQAMNEGPVPRTVQEKFWGSVAVSSAWCLPHVPVCACFFLPSVSWVVWVLLVLCRSCLWSCLLGSAPMTGKSFFYQVFPTSTLSSAPPRLRVTDSRGVSLLWDYGAGL